MAYSLQQVVSDGSLNRITVSIDYIDKANISVFVDDILLPDGTYTWVWDGGDVVITPNVANASIVVVKRSTKFDLPYHDFSAGAVFKDSSIDENFRQMLFIAQEAAEGATATDFYQDLNFHGYRLTKVGNAVADDDAVPFAQYRADTLGAFQQRTLAETARNQAVAAQLASEAARDTSASAAASTAGSVAAASASASAAAASATTALGYRNEAETFRNTAGTSATNAGNSATAAAASAAAAAASAASINDANLLHKTGDETASGLKTFTSLFTATNGIRVTNGNLRVYGLSGNNSAGRVSFNLAETARVEFDGTDIKAVTPAGSGGFHTKYLKVEAADGEGGEVRLGKATGSTLNGDVIVDMDTGNLFRVFESAPPFRGVAIDIGLGGNGVSARITHSSLPVNAIGQIVLAQQVSGTRCDYGNTVGGGNLRPATTNGWTGISSALPGTWRALGQIAFVAGGTDGAATGLWMRVG